MKWFFDMDNPVMRTLSMLADIVILNLLTLFCSLPIVTAGAAFTALNDACIRLVRMEDGELGRDYFRAFKANFKNGTLAWLLFLACAVLLYLDYLAALAYVPQMRAAIFALALMSLPCSPATAIHYGRRFKTRRGLQWAFSQGRLSYSSLLLFSGSPVSTGSALAP